jgi:nitrile hydratase subunit beta
MSERNLAYQMGDRVRIIDLAKRGHVRTPIYVRNKVGVVTRFSGAFENPEDRAYGRKGLGKIRLYRVRFAQRELWPDYAGSADDALELDIYDHWLRPADEREHGH